MVLHPVLMLVNEMLDLLLDRSREPSLHGVQKKGMFLGVYRQHLLRSASACVHLIKINLLCACLKRSPTDMNGRFAHVKRVPSGPEFVMSGSLILSPFFASLSESELKKQLGKSITGYYNETH